MTVKWGVIGCGGIAARRTIPDGIVPARNATLTAVMDVNADISHAIGEKYGVRSYVKEEDIVKDADVEAVYIATPVHLHAKQAVLAAEAGRHVLCEKPLSLTLDECTKTYEVCARNNVKLGIGLMMRFHACHVKAREMIAQGMLGRIVFCRAQLSCWYPPIDNAWRQNPSLGGGGSLMDMGGHCTDILEMIIGSSIKEVSCFIDTLAHRYPVEDTATVMLRFENGALGVVDACFSIPDASSKNRLEIYGTNGSIMAEGTIGQMPDGNMNAFLESERSEYDAGQVRTKSIRKRIKPEPVNVYKAEIEHFSQCIIDRTVPAVSGDDGIWGRKVIQACYESAATGRTVKLNRSRSGS